MNDDVKPTVPAPEATPDTAPTPAEAAKDVAKEIGGRNGPDPVRYGDWEKGGIAVDF
jgi:hypothetical protein